jgi:hypothetical protein
MAQGHSTDPTPSDHPGWLWAQSISGDWRPPGWDRELLNDQGARGCVVATLPSQPTWIGAAAQFPVSLVGRDYTPVAARPEAPAGRALSTTFCTKTAVAVGRLLDRDELEPGPQGGFLSVTHAEWHVGLMELSCGPSSTLRLPLHGHLLSGNRHLSAR